MEKSRRLDSFYNTGFQSGEKCRVGLSAGGTAHFKKLDAKLYHEFTYFILT